MPSTLPLITLPPARCLLLALVLALGHAGLATFAAREKSATADETSHVTGGYTFNRWSDFRMHPENGVLPQRWEALPATFSGVTYPTMDSEAWHKSTVWLVAYDFFYRTGNDPDRMLLSARAMNSLWGAATALLVFCWAYSLWGVAGAFTSLILCILCPTMLAHAGLATSDLCMTFFLLAACTAYGAFLRTGSARAWWLSAIVLGLAAVAKYTSVMLLPIFGLLALARAMQREPFRLGALTSERFPAKLAAIAAATAAQGLVAVAIIWAFFGFRYSMFNPALPAGELNLSWDFVLTLGSASRATIQFCRDWHLLPEGWLYGLAFVLRHAQARAAFLDGEYGIWGWVDFFPKAFLYKTPPTLLVALLAGMIFAALQLRQADRTELRRRLVQVTPLIVLFGVYWAFSLASHLNIGHRHILPTYPVLYIFGGVLGWVAVSAWRRRRLNGGVIAALLGVLLLAHAAVAARIHPHYLAYFSPVVGGPREGYRHLLDSSLDWGQDLPTLKRWLSTHRASNEPVYLSYFGADDPARFNPEATLLPRIPSFGIARPWYWLEPGIYAFSANQFQHLFTPDLAFWNAPLEREYQELHQRDEAFRALQRTTDPSTELLAEWTPLQWAQAWYRYETLRMARLCYYLRAGEPDDYAGYSILIYRLSAEELAAALDTDLAAYATAVAARAHAIRH